MNQYFDIKLKEEYLPDFITKFLHEGKIKYITHGVYEIDQKYFRKLKLQNIQNDILEDEKKLVEFLINEKFVKFLTKEEFSKKSAWSSWGIGVSGTCGSGTYGISGSSGAIGIGIVSPSTTLNIGTCSTLINSVQFHTEPDIKKTKASLGLFKLPFLSRLKKSVK